MAECLVVGQKSTSGSKRATFVVLNKRPQFPMLGASTARKIRPLIKDKSLRRLEDGPVGGTPIHFGAEVIGQAMNAPLPHSGGWNVARVSDLALAQLAYQIANKGLVWLPSMSKAEATKIPVTTVAAIGEVGPYHLDINGDTSSGGIRGPFSISPSKPNSAPTYPVLWSHDAKNQCTLSFDGDCEGQLRKGATLKEQDIVQQKVKAIWNSASHCHFNRDFQFNSQVSDVSAFGTN